MPDLLLFAVVLAALILGHELGHFVAAKLVGVRVEEFGLGFPPRVATLFEWRATRFTLNLIPFGGFVRPAGENDPDIPDGLAAASKRARAFVLLAGPAANILLAFFAFTAAFQFAAPDPERVVITQVAPGSPAEAAGLLPGDLVLQAEGRPIDSFRALQEIVAANLGRPILLKVQRGEAVVEIRLTPRPEPPEGEGPIGVVLGNPTRTVPFPEAARLGARAVTTQFIELLRLPARLIQGQVAPEEARVSGLKGMYDMLDWATDIDRAAQRPFLTLNLIGVISAGLAFANLLPFPALDGGRLMFVLIEAILGHRVSPRYEGLAHAIGFALLLALMAYVNFQDFVNPIDLPR